MIPTTVIEFFARIDFFIFLGFLSLISTAWLIHHSLDTLEDLIVRLRKFWKAIRRDLPDEPRKVIPSPP